MKLTKEQLREFHLLYNVDPNDLNGFDEWAEWLESILNNEVAIVRPEGETKIFEQRQLVQRLDGLRIEVYSNEHPPPHFHVTSPNVDASFTIDGCVKLSGRVPSPDHRKLKHWHRHAKPHLVECWNQARPTVCVVGKI